MAIRAYTYVDRGAARVGNAWTERSWSSFLGVTTDLRAVHAEFDWLRGRSEEFAATIDGEQHRPTQSGAVEWSEENAPVGATLQGQYRSDTVLLTIRSLAFHTHPAILRTTTLMNVSGEPIQIEAATMDTIAVATDELTAEEWEAPRDNGHAEPRLSTPPLVLQSGEHKLLAGTEDEGHVLLMGDKLECHWRGNAFDLFPGKRHTFPAAYLIPHEAGTARAYLRFVDCYRELKT
jgi:hypothetical protein